MKALSAFGFALIPAALGVGALYWLYFAQGTHDFHKELTREKRDALAVKAEPAPEAKIKIIALDRGSLKVEQADQDGSRLVAYVHNTGHTCVPFVELHYKEVAPDGTVIAGDRIYQHDVVGGLAPSQREEITFDNVPIDNRVDHFELWASGEPYACQ